MKEATCAACGKKLDDSNRGDVCNMECKREFLDKHPEWIDDTVALEKQRKQKELVNFFRMFFGELNIE